MPPVGMYSLQGGIWRGHNRADVTPPSVEDGFTPDVTRPVWKGTNNPSNNVGCFYNVSRETVSSIVQAPGKTFENLTITTEVRISQPGQRFINCKGNFSYTGDNGGGVFYIMPALLNGAPRTEFYFCEIEPADPRDRYNGIYGHDFYAYRCAITKTVDGFGFYNSSGAPNNVEVSSCWVGHLAWVADDYGAGRPNGHSDGSGSHNDGGQNGGCPGVSWHGSFLQGAKYNILNPSNCQLDADGVGFVLSPGNGVTPLDRSDNSRHPQCGQAFLGKADAFANIGDIHFHHNWLWNWDHGFKVASNGSRSAGQLVEDVLVHDNIFGGSWRDYGGSQRYYPIRYDSNCVVNGDRPAAGVTVIVDTDGNVWDDEANPGVTYGDGTSVAGSPVRHRIDTVARV